MDQRHRERVMGRLRSQSIDLLVATDVAARGLDIDHLTHVVNYNVPSAPDSYVHRIGRVGRAGREGTAITLVEQRELKKLRPVERATGRPITLEKVPTVGDLRARRLEQTRDALRASVIGGSLDAFRAVVEPLGDEFSLYELALAAVKLAHEASGTAREEEDLPDIELPSDDRRGRRASGRGEGRDSRGDARGASRREGRDSRGYDRRDGQPAGHAPRGGRSRQARTTRLFVGAGRAAGVRAQDLVGAITGESYLSGRDIGAIEIADRFALVEVPESAADDVVAALRRTNLKGRKAIVRRDRHSAG
jgi:ATP-dependent RNA helicase DeaD